MIVFVSTSNYKESWEVLSPFVTGLEKTKLAGGSIPKVVFTSADQTEFYGALGYKSKDGRRAIRKLKAQVKEAQAGEIKVDLPKDFREMWTLKIPNSVYFAEMIELKNGKELLLKLDKRDGVYTYDLDQFVKGTRDYARTLAAKAAKANEELEKPEKLEVLTYEEWTNKSGKSILARFVNLKDGEIEMEREAGDVIKFSVDLLSEKSQKRARKLHASRS